MEVDTDPDAGSPSAPESFEDGRGRRFVLLTTLPRHVLRELTKSVGMALLIFTVLLMAVYMGQIFLRDGASLRIAVQLCPLLIPMISPYVLPFAIITGVLVTYGRLVSEREYLAAQAGGVHPMWLAVPAGLMAGVAVFIVVFLNEFALTPSSERVHAILVADQANILERRLSRPGSLTQRTGGSILAICRLPEESGVAGHDQAGIEIVEYHDAEPGYAFAHPETTVWDPGFPWPTTRIVARDHTIGHVDRDDENQELVVKLRAEKAAHYSFGDGRLVNTRLVETAEADYPMRLGRGGRLAVRRGDLDFASMMVLHQERRLLVLRLAERDEQLRRMADDPSTHPDEFSEARDARRRMARQSDRVVATLHQKIALAFSCFCFAFLGVPMGLATRRGGVAAGGFMMGVGVAVGYYLVLRALEDQVAAGRLEWPVLWIPNLVVLVMATLFVRRARRMAM